MQDKVITEVWII